ncbi:MAG TPA: amino acid adenylation domain-containing protein [Pyrinomonadaceae bacterium]|nr:amino acid adenylation domain-containing protein [Pyrinomonadaceae bacterium]
MFDNELAAALKELSQQEGVTLYMTLLAAFQVLLSRYTGQDDIVVGTDIANRNRAEIEPLIGFFINQLVLRTELGGEPSFRELLGRVREVCLGAYAHQDVPFEKLVEELQPERDLSRGPLFQVKLILQNAPSGELRLPGLKLSRVRGSGETAKFDLTVAVSENIGGMISGTVEYNTDLFEQATIGRLIGHYERLLESIVRDREVAVSELGMLSEEEREQLVVGWNDTGREYGGEECLHELFAAQAERTPGAIAVSYEGEELSYQELNERANQVGHYLRDLGVGPESLVVISMDRSLDMVVGILGILKAGAAYLPIDPMYPQERRSFILEDAEATIILTKRELLAESLPRQALHAVCLDTDWDDIAQHSNQNFSVEMSSENLAYAIYTSGSTGTPNGALITHANVTRLFAATESWVQFGPTDVWTLFHSFTFDFSVWELWGALLYGGRVVIVPYPVSRSPETFYRLLYDEGVTVLSQTPSAFRQLIPAQSGSGDDLALRLIIFGGEALDFQSLRPWFEKHGAERPRLVNMYGITETTVHVTQRPLSIADLNENIGSRVGRPISDLQLYLLDKRLEPVPMGIPGAIYVAGPGLARGYLNRPDLTADRFIPNPFSDEPGDRLYRTGDLARFQASGDVEYLGRIDHQVKIRGFRIELGEVEFALGQHEAVREVLAMVREMQPGDRRLVAYLVADPETPVDAVALRTYLKEKLPDYMIPTSFVMLDAMPLSANGKVNRWALPLPDHTRLETEEAFILPHTMIEEVLAGIWSEVLGVEQVGVHDNFFVLGGDSILSIRVLALAKDRGLNFTLQNLFQHQSIHELAQAYHVQESAALDEPESQPFCLITAEDRLGIPEDVEDAYPLTRLQAGMIFHSEYSAIVYHSIISFRMQLSLDFAALRTAVRQVVKRHPMLRTSFALTGYSEPLQLVHKNGGTEIEYKCLQQGLTVAEQEQAVKDWIDTEKIRHFDWTSRSLTRFHLYQLSEETFQFSFSAPHALFDGWSDGLLLTEMFKRYLSLQGELQGELDPIPTTLFRNYVALERQALESEECRQYWHKQLQRNSYRGLGLGLIAAPDPDSSRAFHLDVPVTGDDLEGLQRLAHLAAVPLKSVLLAAHIRVVSLLSGQRDVITGLVSNGREEEADGERVIGLFLNALPFCMSLDGETWVELARKVFDAEWEMLPYRRYPLMEMQRSHGGKSLFETVFNYTHFHVYESVKSYQNVAIVGGTTVAETNFTIGANFGLNLTLSRVQLNLSGDLTKLSRTQMETIAECYASTLKLMAHDPHERYDRSSPLPLDEQQLMLREWNHTARDYDQDICIHQLFEAQVARTPEAIAVRYEDRHLSYRALNEQANQVAHYLRELGVQPEVLVGLCVERSVEMLVGLLGILKAGGAYVPLDPEYPLERLSFMLEDAGLFVLLIQDHLLDRLPPFWGQTVSLDRNEEITRQQVSNLDSPVTATSLAYAIYTSGSTGTPKGVLVEHRGVSNLTAAQIKAFEVGPQSRVLQFASLSFDASVSEIFTTLFSGATLCLAPKASLLPGGPLCQLLRDGEITTLTIPPSVLRLLECAPLPALQTLIVAGEQCDAATAEQWSKDRRMINAYGPTEATVCATLGRCLVAEDERVRVSPPIGRPIDNVQVYLLDEQLQPMPAGFSAELYIGGAGIARGYLHHADLTAERFLPDPFNSIAGARMYRTGDKARFLPAGVLEYLGRVDEQVKSRGYRIELGEIEAVLSEHAQVRHCVVLMKDQASSEGSSAVGHQDEVSPAAAADKQLVAYVVPAETDQQPTATELRAHMSEKLPEYMLPAAFVLLEELPLTPNGKVNRRALITGTQNRAGLDTSYEPPHTPVEELLVSIWREVLNVERVGVNDNFFELGGHSLLATQLVSRIRVVFEVDVELPRLFESPTVAGLGWWLTYALQAARGVAAPPIVPAARERELPLSFSQQRLWFLNELETNSSFYNIPAAVRLEGELNVVALEQTLSEIVRRHEILRTTYASVNGHAVQVIGDVGEVRLPVLDLSGLSEDTRALEASSVARLEARQLFDLSQGPMLRAHLIKLSTNEHVVLLTMHHIVSDAWSMSVLIREVSTLYQKHSNGCVGAGVPDLPIQYADYAIWQRQWLQGDVLERQLSYWRKRLGGDLPVLALPTDRVRPALQSYQGAHLSFELPVEISLRLKRMSQQEGVTMYMILLAAFQLLLFRYSGQNDILVGTVIAGRTRTETEPLIGLFLNTLVMRTDLSGEPTFRELLRRVREICLGAYAHQEVPFEKLVEELQPERGLSRSPVIQVAFGMHNAPLGELKLGELKLSRVTLETDVTRFDLTLWMMEGGGEGLRATWTYSTALFEAETVKRMHEHFATLLKSIVSEPEARISRLQMLTQEEEEELVSVRRNREGANLTMLRSAKRLPLGVMKEGSASAFGAVDEDRGTEIR